jgi:flavin reductase (DIM6/NTAB) family NADH-FMN oxidoreductase RutF
MTNDNGSAPSHGAAPLRSPSLVGAKAFRDVLGAFLTGVTVVTAFDGERRPRGLTANSFTSVSLDPPLILVCIAKGAGCYDILRSAKRFGVNILGDWQTNISAAFASNSENKFEGVEIDVADDGPPLIRNCLSVLDCARHNVFDAGDHIIVVGRVVGFASSSGSPLGYYRGRYMALGEGAKALEQHGGDAIVVGCIVDDGGRILLWRLPQSQHWSIPTVPLRAGQYHRQVLPELLKRLGVRGDISLLFSVFQDKGDPHTTMVFRGDASGTALENTLPDGTKLRLFAEAEQPWTFVGGTSLPDVLKRYFRERAAARFGIYWDTADRTGRVAALDGEPMTWRSISTGQDQSAPTAKPETANE